MPSGIGLDATRDRVLVRDGYNVLRFWNIEIDHNLEGVLQVIESFLVELSQSPHPGPSDRPSPAGGGIPQPLIVGDT